MNRLLTNWVSSLPSPRKEDVALFLYGLRTPMLLFISPKVIINTSKQTVIKIPLSWATRNSWGTVFFGAIAAGADLTGGFSAFEQAPKLKIGVLYKSFTCQFLRRVDGDLHLVCDDVEAVSRGLEEAHRTGERVNVDVNVKGFVGNHSSETVVAASMVLSLKKLPT